MSLVMWAKIVDMLILVEGQIQVQMREHTYGYLALDFELEGGT